MSEKRGHYSISCVARENKYGVSIIGSDYWIRPSEVRLIIKVLRRIKESQITRPGFGYLVLPTLVANTTPPSVIMPH